VIVSAVATCDSFYSLIKYILEIVRRILLAVAKERVDMANTINARNKHTVRESTNLGYSAPFEHGDFTSAR